MEGYTQQPGAVVQIHPPSTQTAPAAMSHALGVRTTRALGIGQIVCAAVIVVLQIASLVVVHEYELRRSVSHGASGIWCGIIIGICGALGCGAASQRSNPLVISFLVFNVVLTILISPIMIGVTGADLTERRFFFCNYYSSYGNPDLDCSAYEGMVAMTSIMLFASLIALGLSVWGIVTSSVAIRKANACSCCCACCQPPQPPAPVIVYLPASQVAPAFSPGAVPATTEASPPVYSFGNGAVAPVQSQQGFVAQPPGFASGVGLYGAGDGLPPTFKS